MPKYEIKAIKTFEAINAENKEDAIRIIQDSMNKISPNDFFYQVNIIYSEEERKKMDEEKRKNCPHYNVGYDGKCNDCDKIINYDTYNLWHGTSICDDDEEFDVDDFVKLVQLFIRDYNFDGELIPTISTNGVEKFKESCTEEGIIVSNGKAYDFENMVDWFIVSQLNRGESVYNLNCETNNYITAFLNEYQTQLENELGLAVNVQEYVDNLFKEWAKEIFEDRLEV